MSKLVRLIGLAALLGTLLLSASVALAAVPSNAPTTIRSFGFESDSDSASMTPSVGLGTTAFWGRVTNDKHSGTASAWCAARSFPSLGLSNAWPTYQQGTSGDLRVSLPELSDYYSSTLSLWYKMPTIGAVDKAILVYSSKLLNLEPTTSWTHIEGDFASHESKPAAVVRFVDNLELSTEYPKLGTGPIVDDITIRGFKFAPVHSIAVTDTPAGAPIPVAVNSSTSLKLTGNTTAHLITWAKPYTSVTDTTPDSRDIVYRVWRRDSKGQWVELTDSSKPMSAEQIIDAPAAGTYTYAVQPFGADGNGRGMYAERDITISGTSSSSGIASVSYSVDGAAMKTVSATAVTLSSVVTDGKSHTVRFFVTNKNGVASSTQTVNVGKKATISVPKSNISVGYHKGATITAYLKNASGTGLKGYTLYAQSISGGTRQTVATFGALSTAGSYQVKLPYWESPKSVYVTLAPSSSYSASDKKVYVRPQVLFSSLSYSTASPQAYHSFSVKGLMRPAHAGEVRVTAYKVVGTSLSAVKTVKVTSKSTGDFSAAFSLAKGTYQFKASHGSTTSTSEHALTTTSASAKVTVR